MTTQLPHRVCFQPWYSDRVDGLGRRERKKAALRQHISDVATDLFVRHGFDAVSVSQIAETADVARPTVFAHFPRKEDLVFDRYPNVLERIVAAVRDPDLPPVDAVRKLLTAPGAPGSVAPGSNGQVAFWRLIAGSRDLQARARELAEQMESALAGALTDRGATEPQLCAALLAAAYRSVQLGAIREVLAGSPPEQADRERRRRLRHALDAVARAVDTTGAARG
jgi:AcrR family transcriptional regulator